MKTDSEINSVGVQHLFKYMHRPRKYWSDLKSKPQKDVSQLSEKIGRLEQESLYQNTLHSNYFISIITQFSTSPK